MSRHVAFFLSLEAVLLVHKEHIVKWNLTIMSFCKHLLNLFCSKHHVRPCLGIRQICM